MHLTTKNLVFFQIAVERKCTRLDWHVLNWNKLALDFYDRIGAVCLDGWRLYRLTGKRLLEFADKKQEWGVLKLSWCVHVRFQAPSFLSRNSRLNLRPSAYKTGCASQKMRAGDKTSTCPRSDVNFIWLKEAQFGIRNMRKCAKM